MGNFEFIYWDSAYNLTLVVNLAIAIACFASIRYFSGILAHISSYTELVKKDNASFGISMAGTAFAITIIISGAIYGDPINNLSQSIVSVGVYGVVGVVLMALTRIIFDKIALPNISIRDEIQKGNVTAGIIDAGNVIAAALVIRAIMVWIEANTLEGLLTVLTGYVISQVLLTLATLIRSRLFVVKNGDTPLEREFKKGNIALGLRFAGKRIGSAFAITAASNLMVYQVFDMQLMLFAWSLVSIAMLIAVSCVCYLSEKIILFNINLDKEVIKQKNIAIGALECIIFISIAMLISELTA